MTKSYQDINYNFKKDSITLVLTDEQVVNQALNTLFTTPKGSRLFNREYGSSLDNIIFENMTPSLEDVIKMTVYDDIKRFEPRVLLKSIDDVDVLFDYDNNSLTISVVYKLKNNESISGNFVKQIDINN